MKEYWNDLLTKASWEKLQNLSKEFDFILIGGWSIFLWTGKHKSKGIDIIIDYSVLSSLQENYTLIKNDRLKKYEIKFDKFDIDIYLPFYSKLAIPINEIKQQTLKVQGIKTIKPEVALILKQAAELDRRNTIKGQKDVLDILTLLIFGGVDLQQYIALLKKYSLVKYIKELIYVIQSFNTKNIDYLDMNLKQFVNWKKGQVSELKKLYGYK